MWTKICGIRDIQTAQAVAHLKADAIGLNFYPASSRCVSVAVAQQIVGSLPDSAAPVGLFVNEPPARVVEICAACAIGMAQLHGDESPDELAEIQDRAPQLQLIRAVRVGEAGLAACGAYLQACAELSVELFGVLIDAQVRGSYGGSGHTAPWEIVAEEYRVDAWPRLILAGGLHPGNVEAAVHRVRPWGVDVASGVESQPGVKNIELVSAFLANARAADVSP